MHRNTTYINESHTLHIHSEYRNTPPHIHLIHRNTTHRDESHIPFIHRNTTHMNESLTPDTEIHLLDTQKHHTYE